MHKYTHSGFMYLSIVRVVNTVLYKQRPTPLVSSFCGDGTLQINID